MWDWLKTPKSSATRQEQSNEPATRDALEAPKNKVIVITGTSGSGRKSTAKQLSMSLGVPYLCPYTTRSKRPGERDGEHYHFISEDKFQTMLERKEFFQSVHLERGQYGISESELQDALEEHKAAIVVVNHEGAEAFHKKFGEDAIRIFIYVTKNDIRLRLEREAAPFAILDEYLENYTEQVIHKKESEYLLQNIDPAITVGKIKEFLLDKI